MKHTRTRKRADQSRDHTRENRQKSVRCRKYNPPERGFSHKENFLAAESSLHALGR